MPSDARKLKADALEACTDCSKRWLERAASSEGEEGPRREDTNW